jgi:hypothetical protein
MYLFWDRGNTLFSQWRRLTSWSSSFIRLSEHCPPTPPLSARGVAQRDGPRPVVGQTRTSLMSPTRTRLQPPQRPIWTLFVGGHRCRGHRRVRRRPCRTPGLRLQAVAMRRQAVGALADGGKAPSIAGHSWCTACRLAQ